MRKMINKEFVDLWCKRYDEQAAKRDMQMENEIKNALKELFPNDKTKYITRDILYNIAHWKAPRIRNGVLKNDNDFVEETTKHCFLSLNERFKIEALTILSGVGYPVATAILHFCFPSVYTILDFRAWWTLQQKGYLKGYEIAHDFEHWQRYLSVCREISKQCGCSLRELDKALWQYSNENQP